MATERGWTDEPADSKERFTVIIPIAALLLLAVAVAVIAFGGRDGSTSSASCGEVISEQIDPQSAVHLLPSSPEPPYLTDPPTSGPHVMGPAIQGAQDQPLSRPIQAGILERGAVLVQYSPTLSSADVAALVGLSGPEVVVAPNPVVDGVVATAWGKRLTCTSVDIAPIERFSSTYSGSGSQMGGGG